MKIWTPRWTVSTPQVTPTTTSYFGGVPHGLAAQYWPTCMECGLVMTPLLQLAWGPWLSRIPKEHTLFIFKCESEDICDFWESDSGANACLLVANTELSASSIEPPPRVVDGNTRLLPQIWIDSWLASDDSVTTEQAFEIDDDVRYWDLPDEIQSPHGFDSAWLTKAGGAPYWTGNGPDNDPPRPRQLLFQIDNWITISDPHKTVVEHLAKSKDGGSITESGSFTAANFMSDGIAYIFDITPDSPNPTFKLTIKR